MTFLIYIKNKFIYFNYKTVFIKKLFKNVLKVMT